MKNNKILLLIFGISVLMFQSCKKYLDKKPSSILAVPTSLTELQAILDNVGYMNQQVTPSSGEASSDDYFLLANDFNIQKTRDQDLYRWIPNDNYFFPNDWSASYFPVYNSNYCLEGLDKIPVSAINKTDWENVKGSALFFRSYYFLHLLWTYAKGYDETNTSDLGIPLRTVSDFNVPSVRASVKDSYNKIINDTKQAIHYLPSNPLHVFRPSKAAAYALLARTYLSMRNYDSAYRYADLSLGIKNQLINMNPSAADPDFLGASAASPFKQFNKETIFYTEWNLYNTPINPFYAKIDTTLYSSYASNDYRKQAFFAPTNGYFSFKGSYSQSTVYYFTGLAVDEMYLIRAECFARKADKTNALIDLNTLLSKRHDATFVAVTATDANDALGKILLERRKELLMRTIRFGDLKRLNNGGANIVPKRVVNGQTYTLSPNDNRYALPLPKEIVDQGIPQN